MADEPTEAGGTDEGPNPYELLLGALGSCTAMTILMYARRKKWPVEHVRVELDHSRVHVQRLRGVRGARTSSSTTSASGSRCAAPLSEEQRAKLAEISQRCPVHRTLTGTIRIDDEVRLEPPAT